MLERNNEILAGVELQLEDMDKKIYRGKSKKVLTSPKKKSIIKLVNKLNERTNKMAKDKNNKNSKGSVIKTAAWLVEAAFRFFAGWLLLAKFDHLITTAAAFYALGTGAVIVGMHFFNAHKK